MLKQLADARSVRDHDVDLLGLAYVLTWRERRVYIRIGVATLGRRGVWPAEQATREGRTRDREHLQRREHLALLLAVHERVVVLHRDEGRQVVRDRVVCGGVVSAALLAIVCGVAYSASE